MGDLVRLLTTLREPAGPPAHAAARVQDVADSLLDQLQKSGFDQHPPTNIHALVATTNLTATEQHKLLGLLNEAYPGGLGVNMLG